MFHPEHNQWHLSAVAEFKIMRGDPMTGTTTSLAELNNFTWIKFHLERSSGANPSVTELGHSPCSYPLCGFGGNP